jgi:ubiquitin-hydrolase Zn-finger-containing protein
MRTQRDGINLEAVPSGTGCAECLASEGWWFHLRRCAECGHIGCCDSSPGQHASKHYAETGHSVIRSFEPGERWFYDYRTDNVFGGPGLAPPESHPVGQPAPGPAGRVPANWQDLLHE